MKTDTTPFNIPAQAEILAFNIIDSPSRGKTYKEAIDLAADALRLAFEVGYKRGLKEAGSDLI